MEQPSAIFTSLFGGGNGSSVHSSIAGRSGLGHIGAQFSAVWGRLPVHVANGFIW